MVKEIKRAGKILYQCEVCGNHYAEKKWAEKCQEWCETHDGCSVEIAKHSEEYKNRKK